MGLLAYSPFCSCICVCCCASVCVYGGEGRGVVTSLGPEVCTVTSSLGATLKCSITDVIAISTVCNTIISMRCIHIHVTLF